MALSVPCKLHLKHLSVFLVTKGFNDGFDQIYFENLRGVGVGATAPVALAVYEHALADFAHVDVSIKHFIYLTCVHPPLDAIGEFSVFN